MVCGGVWCIPAHSIDFIFLVCRQTALRGPCLKGHINVTIHSTAPLVMFCVGSLLPGALVNARVRHILGDGLQLSFLTYFSGTVDIFHLAQVTGP